jgi:hypothetical protein
VYANAPGQPFVSKPQGINSTPPEYGETPARSAASNPLDRRTGRLRHPPIAWVIFALIVVGVILSAINGNGQ